MGLGYRIWDWSHVDGLKDPGFSPDSATTSQMLLAIHLSPPGLSPLTYKVELAIITAVSRVPWELIWDNACNPLGSVPGTVLISPTNSTYHYWIFPLLQFYVMLFLPDMFFFPNWVVHFLGEELCVIYLSFSGSWIGLVTKLVLGSPDKVQDAHIN